MHKSFPMVPISIAHPKTKTQTHTHTHTHMLGSKLCPFLWICAHLVKQWVFIQRKEVHIIGKQGDSFLLLGQAHYILLEEIMSTQLNFYMHTKLNDNSPKTNIILMMVPLSAHKDKPCIPMQ